jgi:hypothetical protein
VLLLPMHCELSDEQVEQVVSAVQEFGASNASKETASRVA